MGYRDDAFYKLPSSESDSAVPRANAKFAYPGNQIRFLAAQSELDNRGNNDDAVSRQNRANPYTIKRGYIRGLDQPGIGAALKPIKCAFQFNPQTILQTVTMREDMYLPILQDPSQFTQPLASSVNFNFDLVFDRSHEVANGRVPGSSKYTPANIDSPDYANDAGDIGAMSDLQVLYSIIGQGFSKELVDFQAKRLEQVSNRKSQDTEGYEAISLDQIKKSISDANVGNAAFLIPNPVRVIFSSLFMVDGFVTGTTVDYLKFNTNMVPIQVKVGVSMQAVYIGFAKKRTFLTDQLEAAGVEARERAAESAAEETQLAKLSVKGLNYLSYGIGSISDDSYWENTVNGIVPSQSQVVTVAELGTKSIGSIGANVEIVRPLHLCAGFRDFEDSQLSELIADGQSVTISYSWTLKVYGPYDTENEAKAFVKSKKKPTQSSKFVGNYSGSVDSSDPKWRRKTFENISNTASNTMSKAQAEAAYNKFFLTVMEATTSIKGANSDQSRTNAEWKVVKQFNDQMVRGKVAYSWTTTPLRNGGPT